MGKTLVLATSDPLDALALGDTVVFIDQGRVVVQVGSPRDEYYKPVRLDIARYMTGKILNEVILSKRFENGGVAVTSDVDASLSQSVYTTILNVPAEKVVTSYPDSTIIGKTVGECSGRPYLSRAAEEHSGPHNAWFWVPSISGGGVLIDMACHSIEASRYLLLDPKSPKNSLRPVEIFGETAFLKWVKEEYREELRRRFNIDFSKEPAEDYALTIVKYEDETGDIVISEARTSWSFVGAGLRLTFEILGPEYSASINTLQPELFTFISRNIRIPASEEFVEKQNAEQGLMPVLPDEAFTYGYQAEDAHMVESFLAGKLPFENWYDGKLVVELMMHAYLSAEKGGKVRYDPQQVENYTPLVARRKV
ncbi:MAG: Gfo/Idh/MocA family oxidoreductase [Thermosphaera sp.]